MRAKINPNKVCCFGHNNLIMNRINKKNGIDKQKLNSKIEF